MNLASKIILLSAVILVSCATPNVMQDIQRDSVVVVIKDTVILKDSVVLVEIPMETTKSVAFATDTSHLETSVAWSEAYINDLGQICHMLENKEALLPISITIPNYVHSEQKENAVFYKKVEVVEVEHEMTKWESFIQKLGYGVLIAFIIWLVVRLSKFFI